MYIFSKNLGLVCTLSEEHFYFLHRLEICKYLFLKIHTGKLFRQRQWKKSAMSLLLVKKQTFLLKRIKKNITLENAILPCFLQLRPSQVRRQQRQVLDPSPRGQGVRARPGLGRPEEPGGDRGGLRIRDAEVRRLLRVRLRLRPPPVEGVPLRRQGQHGGPHRVRILLNSLGGGARTATLRKETIAELTRIAYFFWPNKNVILSTQFYNNKTIFWRTKQGPKFRT